MTDRESYKLIGGPYPMPRCRVGGTLTCEFRGRDVKVKSITNAPISWPSVYPNRVSPILCGSLLSAVRLESRNAVAHHWGVSPGIVNKWRRAIGVGKWTPGTRRLIVYYIKKGQRKSRSSESRAKMSAAKRGRPPLPQFRAGALRAACRPKSEAWKRKLSARLRKEWAPGGIRRVQVAKRKRRVR